MKRQLFSFSGKNINKSIITTNATWSAAGAARTRMKGWGSASCLGSAACQAEMVTHRAVAWGCTGRCPGAQQQRSAAGCGHARTRAQCTGPRAGCGREGRGSVTELAADAGSLVAATSRGGLKQRRRQRPSRFAGVREINIKDTMNEYGFVKQMACWCRGR